MKLITGIFSFLFVVTAQAHIQAAPPNFTYQNGKAIFVDMQKATYNLLYDVVGKTASAHSEITFTMDEAGYPIFDLVPNILLAEVDGQNVEVALVRSPDRMTDLRVVQKKLSAGQHTLVIENSITKYLKFAADGVANAFFMDDSVDRGFLEVFLPTNLQYDQYKMQFNIQVIGSANAHEVLSTGVVQSTGTNSWSVNFPDYFNSAALYLHIAKVGYFEKLETTLTNKNGKTFPVLIYKRANGPENLNRFLSNAKQSIEGLENNFVAWPHPNLVIYATESEEGYGGGMEHCGATMSSYSALQHELSHSFFGRGFMPKDGNSAWIDEALAMWTESYNTLSSISDSSDNMGNVGAYYRSTKRSAYYTGADMMAYFEGKTAKMRPFLQDFLNRHMFQTISNADFQNELEAFTGEDFSKEFNKYVYGPALTAVKTTGKTPYRFSETQLDAMVK